MLLTLAAWGCSSSVAGDTPDATADAGADTGGGGPGNPCRINKECVPSADCLIGVCDPATKTCAEEIKPGACYVGATAASELSAATPGVCYATGDTNPKNACQHCDPKDSDAALLWTYKPGQEGFESESVIDTTTQELTAVCVDPCERYCGEIESTCAGTVRQYSADTVSGAVQDEAGFIDCRKFCLGNWLRPEKPDAGAQAPSDARGSEAIACRYAAAQAAQKGGSDAVLMCPRAGPTGGDLCGSLCENYCHLTALNCGSLFPNFQTCLDQCAAVSTTPSPNPRSGDNIQCRIVHAGLAALENASANCKEAQIVGTSACVNNADIKGDSCFNPLRVDHIPFFAEATTKGARSDYKTPCAKDGAAEEPAAGPGTPDHTWALDAQAGESYSITLTPSFAAEFVVLTNTCGALRCSATSTPATAYESTTIYFEPTSTGTFYVLVDGQETAGVPSLQVSGTYTLAVDRGPTCKDYCTKVTAICSDPLTQQYGIGTLPEGKTAFDECIRYCDFEAKIAPGSTSDSHGNTVGCRLFNALKAEQVLKSLDLCSSTEQDQVSVAAEVRALCNAAGKTGAGVCGTTCDNFCHLATARCTDANLAYESTSQCEKNCNNYAEGQALDLTGNSKSCRLNQVALAPVAFAAPEGGAPPTNAVELASACAAAKDKSTVCVGDCTSNCADRECGPTSCGKSCGTCATGLTCTGQGKCQPDCDRYCDVALCNCPSAYANRTACMAQCTAEATTADTAAPALLECMTWQAAHAGDSTDLELQATRCAASGPDGWATCGSWCTNYCDLAMKNCSATPKLYNTVDDCLSACALIPVDPDALSTGFPIAVGDTVQCRLNYLFLAAQTPVLSCPEALPADLAVPGGTKACAAK